MKAAEVMYWVEKERSEEIDWSSMVAAGRRAAERRPGRSLGGEKERGRSRREK
jgi:hypothetical protein